MKTPSSILRRQERSEVTRARLLRSAERIFARDGFEAAKLEEIAAHAGYTRGAFYVSFSSKEDLFLALLEGEISSRIDKVEKLLQEHREPRAKLRAFRQFFLSLSEDRRWSLLALEFKLFAVRHPEAKARLVALNRRLVGRAAAAGAEELAQPVRPLAHCACGLAFRGHECGRAGAHTRPQRHAGRRNERNPRTIF